MLACVFVSVICCVWGLVPKGLLEVDCVGLWGPRTLQGPHTNEACSSLMEQIQEKQTCDVVPSGGPESLVERNRTLVEFVCICVCVCWRGDKREYLQYFMLIGVCYFELGNKLTCEWRSPPAGLRHFCSGSDDLRTDFLLVWIHTERHAPGHVLLYSVIHLDLLVISAEHILSYQTWLKLSPCHESCLGVDMMYFSRTSSGWTCLLTTVAKLFRVNLSTQKHSGGTVTVWGLCDSWECCHMSYYWTSQIYHNAADSLSGLESAPGMKTH